MYMYMSMYICKCRPRKAYNPIVFFSILGKKDFKYAKINYKRMKHLMLHIF